MLRPTAWLSILITLSGVVILSTGRVCAAAGIRSYRQRCNACALQGPDSTILIPGSEHRQAQLQQVFDDFSPAHAPVRLQEKTLPVQFQSQCLAPFPVSVYLFHRSTVRRMVRPSQQCSSIGRRDDRPVPYISPKEKVSHV